MEKTNQRIEDIKRDGVELDFSEVFNPAFEIYKKIVGPAGVIMLLLIVVIAVIAFIGLFAAVGFNGMATNMQSFSPINLSFTFLMLYCVVIIAGAILSILLTAGFLQMAYNAFHNLDFSMGTAFKHFKSEDTKELVIGATIVAIPNLIQILFFEYIHLTLVGSLVSGIISLFTFLMVPLIIFGKLKAVDAILGSIHVILKNFLMIFLLLIVSYIIAIVGIIGCGIGVAFTIPFMYAMIISIYIKIFEIPASNAQIDSITKQNFI